MTEPNDPFAVPDQPAGGSTPPTPPPGYGTPAPPPQGYGAPPSPPSFEQSAPPSPPGYGPPQGQPPAWGQQQPWGQPAYGTPGGPAASGKTNTLAIIALVASFFCSPAGLICGIVARGQIKERGEGGSGLALAAIIISAIGMVFGILIIGAGFIGAGMVDSTAP